MGLFCLEVQIGKWRFFWKIVSGLSGQVWNLTVSINLYMRRERHVYIPFDLLNIY